MRNSSPSNSSQRRGHKGRKPNDKNDRRGGNGQRTPASSGNRNGQQRSGSGQQRQASSRGKSRSQVLQMWTSDTTTLSSHMLKAANSEWNPKAKKTDSKSGAVSRSRGKNKSFNGKNRSGKFERNPSRNRNQPHSRSSSEAAAKQAPPANRDAAPREGKQVGNIDPFELFCAYHLGITQDKGYRTANINEVAKRFRSEQGMIKQALKEYDMDSESLLDRDFDMALAQLDIQVAPEGVDRLELARGIYDEFQNAPRIKRDWKKILEEDRKENQKVFRN